MNIIRAWAFRVGVLVVVLFAAIGAWKVFQEAVRPVAQAQAENGWNESLPDFKCYKLGKVGAAVGTVVTLTDQFGTEGDVTVGKPKLLCAPATKSVND
jgi:hypothetical protein